MDLQIYLIALFSAVTIFSTLAFYAEEGQPNTQFTSIPAAMWWCIVTITTTGYGDMYPSTVGGRLVAAATMITGLALFGLLMNVVGKAMLTSLFGSENLEAHHPPGQSAEGGAHVEESAGVGAAIPAAAEVGICGCGQPLSPAWRLCPMCGTPTARALR
jgi:hypothetical protein